MASAHPATLPPSSLPESSLRVNHARIALSVPTPLTREQRFGGRGGISVGSGRWALAARHPRESTSYRFNRESESENELKSEKWSILLVFNYSGTF